MPESNVPTPSPTEPPQQNIADQNPIKPPKPKWMMPASIGAAALVVAVGGYFAYMKLRSKPAAQPAVNQNSAEEFQGKFAFLRQNNLWTSQKGKEKQITSDAGAGFSGVPWYSHPQLSPDGSKIVVLKHTREDTGGEVETDYDSIVVYNFDGSGMKVLKKLSNLEYYPAWTSDGLDVVYSTVIESNDQGALIPTRVHRITVKTGTDKALGTVKVGSGCGGGSDDPGDWLAGYEGGYFSPAFFLSVPGTQNLVHASGCGSIVGEYNLSTGKDVTFNDNRSDLVAISKQGAIAYTGDKLITLENGLKKSFTTPDNPDSMGWSNDGKTLFFTTSTPGKELHANDDLGNDLTGREYRVSLYRLDLASGKSTKITDFSAHFGRIVTVASNGSKLLLSLAGNASKYFAYREANKNVDSDHVPAEYLPVTTINEVNLSSGAAKEILSNSNSAEYLP